MAMPERLPGKRGSARRLLLALAVSLLCHLLILGGWRGAAGSGPAQQSSLQAQLAAPDIPAEGIAQKIALSPPALATAQPGRILLPGPSVLDNPVEISQTRAAVADGQDSRYYPARELDQYPAPLVPIRTGAHDPDDGGSVRLWVSIDQYGRVVDVTVADVESTGMAEQRLRELVLGTPFHPAHKDGRAVKSRLLLVVRYGV